MIFCKAINVTIFCTVVYCYLVKREDPKPVGFFVGFFWLFFLLVFCVVFLLIFVVDYFCCCFFLFFFLAKCQYG